MTISKEQAQAALDWFNKANWNPNVQEVQTIRTALQERLSETAPSVSHIAPVTGTVATKPVDVNGNNRE